MDKLIGTKLVNEKTGQEIWIRRVDDPLDWDYPVFVANQPPEDGCGYAGTGWRESFESLKKEYKIVERP